MLSESVGTTQYYVVHLQELSTTTDCHMGVGVCTVGKRRIGTATDAVFAVPGPSRGRRNTFPRRIYVRGTERG